eukprot:84654-Prymnesium_polylepis.1
MRASASPIPAAAMSSSTSARGCCSRRRWQGAAMALRCRGSEMRAFPLEKRRRRTAIHTLRECRRPSGL